MDERRNGSKRNGLPVDMTYVNQAANEIGRLQMIELRALEAKQQGQAPNPPTKPVETPTTGSGGGGSKGSTPRESRVAEYQRELNLLLDQNELAKFTLGFRDKELQKIELINREINAYLETEKEIADIKDSDLYTDEKKIKIKIAEAKLDSELTKVARDRLNLQFEATQKFEQQEKALVNALELESAITEEQKRQVKLNQELADIEELGLGSSREQRLKDLVRQRAALEAANANPLKQYMDGLQQSLSDTDSMIVALAQTIEGELGKALSDTFTGVVDGSKTASEAFRDMFANVGKAFIDMATQIIAKQMVMITMQSILKALGGPTAQMSGGSPINFASPDAGVLSSLGGIPTGYANGGTPPMGQPSIVGERGPELFIPNQSGRVVSNEAMGNYMPSNSSSSSGGPITINYNGPMLNFNGDDYIPRSEAPKLVEQGAKMGEQRTMNHLRNNRSSRQRVGI